MSPPPDQPGGWPGLVVLRPDLGVGRRLVPERVELPRLGPVLGDGRGLILHVLGGLPVRLQLGRADVRRNPDRVERDTPDAGERQGDADPVPPLPPPAPPEPKPGANDRPPGPAGEVNGPEL